MKTDMFLNLAETVSENTLGGRTLEALKDTFIGMLVVFVALSILWLVIEIFHRCVAAFSKKEDKAENKSDKPADEIKTVEIIEDSSDDDGAIVAAITAAISAYTDAPAGSFRVVSFRKTQNNAHWNKR